MYITHRFGFETSMRFEVETILDSFQIQYEDFVMTILPDGSPGATTKIHFGSVSADDIVALGTKLIGLGGSLKVKLGTDV